MYESPPSAAYRGRDGDRGHGGCAPSSEPGDITADLGTDVSGAATGGPVWGARGQRRAVWLPVSVMNT